MSFGAVADCVLECSVCVTTILRMLSLDSASRSDDPNYGTFNSDIWTSVEANTGIICACMPMLKAPLTLFFPRFFSSGGPTSCDASGARRYSSRPGLRKLDGTFEDTIRLEHGSQLRPGSRGHDFSESYHVAGASADSAERGQSFQGRDLPMGVIKAKTEMEVQYDDNPKALQQQQQVTAKEFLNSPSYQGQFSK